MKANELKYGMYVELRNGEIGIINPLEYKYDYSNREETTINTRNGRYEIKVIAYDDNLKHREFEQRDIVKVFDNDMNVIYEEN